MASFEAIATINVTSGVNSVTFSSIPATYKHLQVRCLLRTDGSVGGNTPLIRMNGETSTVYSGFGEFGNPSASSTTYYTIINSGQTYIQPPNYCIPDASNPANTFGICNFEISDYASTSKHKAFSGFVGWTGSSGGYRIGYFGGHCARTQAVSSLTIFATSSANFVSGSVFALYGWGD